MKETPGNHVTEVHVDSAAPEVRSGEQGAYPPPHQQGPQPRGMAQHLVEGEDDKLGSYHTQVCRTARPAVEA